MSSTNFQDYNQNTPIVAAWLNDVNDGTYTTAGTARTALQISAAWVRFSITAGVVTIQQSVGIATVVRTGVGVYVVTYAAPMTSTANCYEANLGTAGFAVPSAETLAGVTLTCTNTANAAADPAFVSLVVHGAN